MSDPELLEEMRYRIEERLAILCGDSKPTPKQYRLAKDEALEAVKKLYDDSGTRHP